MGSGDDFLIHKSFYGSGHDEYNFPVSLIFLKLNKHSKLLKFHNFKLLSSADIDIIKSVSFILSKQCLKLVISELWAFLTSNNFLLSIKS